MEDSERLPRKLAAILYADVAGYSRLTSEDEDATHRRLSDYLDLIAGTVESHRGRVMHYAGDAVLAMFQAVVDALSCAAQIQRDIQSRNEDLPEDRKVQFRIGVNLGDVIEDRGDIYGDGVNVAARLESLAEPGAICVSESVRTAVGNKLPLEFEFMGEQKVKNIREPVRAFHARLAVDAELQTSPKTSIRRGVEPTPRTRTERTASPLPDKPSIVVLPFDNMSADPEQEYFSDGITEDIITALSTSTDLLVIARHSSFTYKGKSVTVQQVAQELAVRYVLEGSVRKVSDQVRITVQLIDGTTGHHVWADRYDQKGSDVFAIQDEVTEKILASIGGIQGRITQDATRHAWAKNTPSLDEYDYFLRGLSLHLRFTKYENTRARKLFEEGLAIFPNSSLLRVMLAWTYRLDVTKRWSDDRDLGRAYELAQQVLADERAPLRAQWLGHWLMAFLCVDYKRDFERALAEREATLALVPGGYAALGDLSFVLCCAGMPDEAIASLEKAMRADPTLPQYHYHLGRAKYVKGRYQEAIEQFEKTPWSGEPFRAASYAQLGLIDKARAEVEEIVNNDPEVSISSLRDLLSYKNPDDLERVLDGLRKAGLPD